MNIHRALAIAILLAPGLACAQTPTTVMVPMRDGVRLATDIYLPEGKGPWPAVLVRSYHNKSKKLAPDVASESWTPKGYVYVVQDWRGHFASEGKFTIRTLTGTGNAVPQNAEDGYDTIEWVAHQSWCNGKIGMLGGSGEGIATKQAILMNPPHLVAAFTNFATMFPADYELYHGGVLVGQSESWFAGQGARLAAWPKPRMPMVDFHLLAWPPAHQVEHDSPSGGKRIALLDNGGWYDIFNPSSVDDFMARQSPSSRVVIGARGHAPMTGSLTYPPQSLPGDSPQAWMDHWLKGVENGVMDTPPIRYFLMGDTLRKGAPGNVWKQADTWPVANTPTSYYLSDDGSLQLTAPAAGTASRSYPYDPRNPAPMVGGNNMGENKGPMDQRKLDSRDDILRFQTAPLSGPVTVTGKVMVELYVSADVPDTTVMAKLIDIYPNGYQALVLDNAIMARYHDGFDKPAPLEKGKVYKLRLYLWNTALIFDRGHRIALHVTGSNAPRYEVHPNSFEPVSSYDAAPVAHVAVQTSQQYASRLILPVLP